MVIPSTLALLLAPSSFNQVPARYEQAILENHSFLDREKAEVNPAFKQVIPYIIVRYLGLYLLTQRTNQQQEARLHNLYSIGQGGHINDKDSLSKDPILTGLMRELREEFTLAPEYGCSAIGLINDDSTEVGKYHVGIVYELRVNAPLLEVAEKDKHIAQWADVPLLRTFYARMENWSQIIMDHAIRS